MRPVVADASEMGPSDFQGWLPVVRRAVLRRQFDSLDAISHLVTEGRGHAAPPLLRPSCEELIWISYLARIDDCYAEELIACKAASEVLDHLRAQYKECGPAVMKELGLLREYERKKEGKNAVRERIRSLGGKLGWPDKVIEEAGSPSVLWLAKKSGRKDIYDYIYSATSRFVHFSAQQLFRHAWYKPESANISVGSEHFRDFWGRFSLQWGFRLFFESAIELSKAPGMPEEWLNDTSLLSTVKRVSANGKVPIITADELAVPE